MNFIALLFVVYLFFPQKVESGTIFYSKHDLAHLNERVMAKGKPGAMTGRAFNDYGDVCIYCHTASGGTNMNSDNPMMWNRQVPDVEGYTPYQGPTGSMDVEVGKPSGVSLVCLSCHDGTVAVDAIREKPIRWKDSGVHYKMNPSTEGENCGKCHARKDTEDGLGPAGAHNAAIKYLSQDLRDDHPVSMPYPNQLGIADIGGVDPMFRTPEKSGFFPNGVRLFGGKVQCASCHDVHNPDEENKEGRHPFLRSSNFGSALCLTCHIK